MRLVMHTTAKVERMRARITKRQQPIGLGGGEVITTSVRRHTLQYILERGHFAHLPFKHLLMALHIVCISAVVGRVYETGQLRYGAAHGRRWCRAAGKYLRDPLELVRVQKLAKPSGTEQHRERDWHLNAAVAWYS